jgi:Uma2 family endonuclease
MSTILPEGTLFARIVEVVPDVIIEVRLPEVRWLQIHRKVAEYLEAGVTYVCVFDEQTRSCYVVHSDDGPRIPTADK